MTWKDASLEIGFTENVTSNSWYMSEVKVGISNHTVFDEYSGICFSYGFPFFLFPCSDVISIHCVNITHLLSTRNLPYVDKIKSTQNPLKWGQPRNLIHAKFNF